MTERTTGELITKLGTDVERCHDELIQCIERGERSADGTISADYEYHARQLVRAILAYIEGVTFSVKVWSVHKCLESGKEVSDHERYAAVEVDADLNDKGEIVERPAKLRLASNVRFALRMLARAEDRSMSFDPSSAWWSDLRKTIAVRDRLTHPRYPADVDVSPDELIAALRAKVGFELALGLEVSPPSPKPTRKRKKPNKSVERTA